MQKTLFFTLMTCLSSAAAAQSMDCTFATECLDTDGCSQTTYELRLMVENTMATLSDMNGDAVGDLSITDGHIRVTTGSFPASETSLSVTPSGDARYVMTLSDIPMIITYAGKCETTE